MSERRSSSAGRPEARAAYAAALRQGAGKLDHPGAGTQLLLDGIAHAVVSRCDGVASLGEIVDDLCAASRRAARCVAADVAKLIQDFADKGVMPL